jgi:anti-anti-sigma factor
MDQFPGILGTSAWTATLGVGRFEQRSITELARFKAECQGTVSLLHVSGEVDISNSRALDAAIAEASRANEGAILVSFVDCRFADGSCLRVLIRQFNLLSSRLLIVAPPGSGLRHILDVASLTSKLPVYDSLRQAHLAIASDLCGLLGALAMWRPPEAMRDRLEDRLIDRLSRRGCPR